MLITRIRQAQSQLQSHQTWLRAFVVSQSSATARLLRPITIDRTFSTVHARELETSSKLSKRLSKTSKSKHRQKRSGRETPKLEVLSHREDLLEALKDEDLKTAISLYAALPEKKPLTADDVHALAKLVSRACRSERFKSEGERSQNNVDEIAAFATQLTTDIRRERLMPSTHAHVHLLVTFKESGNIDAGIDFWTWLEAQDETYTNLEVYAVAIDLLAINGTPLPELEQLYQDGLARFPGTFSAYHLSPDAMLPDREKPLDIKVPTVLLQAITFARLLHGDSRNAYLALDTVFRLYPTTVSPRFLQGFLKERPISEVYTVLAMSCRAGISLRQSDFKQVLPSIRKSSDLTSSVGHIAILRVMVATIYLFLGSCGTLTSNSVNELIIAMTQVCRLTEVETMNPEQRTRLSDTILDTIRKTMEVFARYGAKPTTTAFNSIIANVAGCGRAEGVISMALVDMDRIGLKPNHVTRRSILTAAGRLRDAPLVEQTWQDIVSTYTSMEMSPDVTDWIVFCYAASRAGIKSFAQAEFDLQHGGLSESAQAAIQARLDHDLDETTTSTAKNSIEEFANMAEIFNGMEKLQADLVYVEEQTRDRPVGHVLNDHAVPTELMRDDYPLALPEQEMHRLYDELTTEPSSRRFSAQPDTDKTSSAEFQTPPAAPSKLSITNIALGTLRYENWKSINYLLWLSGKHDQEYAAAVDKAIAVGKRPPPRNLSLLQEELKSLQPFGLSEEAGIGGGAPHSEEHIKKAKRDILNLRRKI